MIKKNLFFSNWKWKVVFYFIFVHRCQAKLDCANPNWNQRRPRLEDNPMYLEAAIFKDNIVYRLNIRCMNVLDYFCFHLTNEPIRKLGFCQDFLWIKDSDYYATSREKYAWIYQTKTPTNVLSIYFYLWLYSGTMRPAAGIQNSVPKLESPDLLSAQLGQHGHQGSATLNPPTYVGDFTDP